MGSVKIHGASDDTIVVYGDIEEEWLDYDTDARVELSTGDKVRVWYDDVNWRVEVQECGPGSSYEIVPVHSPDEHVVLASDHDDTAVRITTHDPIRWVEVTDWSGEYLGRVTVKT